MASGVLLQTHEIDAQNYSITTTGTMNAHSVVVTASVNTPLVSATTSLTTPSILSSNFIDTDSNGAADSDAFLFGDDDPFLFTRPQTTNTSINGKSFTIQGQPASDIGGNMIVRPGVGPSADLDGKVKMQDAQGNTVLSYGTATLDGGSAVTAQKLDLGETAAEVEFVITRDVSTAGAGATVLRGQTPTGNNYGGDVHVEGGTSGRNSRAGGGIYIDGGASLDSSVYGTVVIGATSGGVQLGSADREETQFWGDVTVAGAMTVNNILPHPSSTTVAIGADDKFVFSRPQHSAGHASDLTIAGQDGASLSNYNGGDIILQPGIASNTPATDGLIRINCLSYATCSEGESDADGAPCALNSDSSDCAVASGDCTYVSAAINKENCTKSAMEVAADRIDVNVPMYTAAIDAGTHDITTTGTVRANVVIADNFTTPYANIESIETPLLKSATGKIAFGDDDSFTLGRPATTGAGTDFVIAGQAASGGAGGDIVLQPGNGTASCTGTDGTGAACTLDGDATACEVTSGNCTYSAGEGVIKIGGGTYDPATDTPVMEISATKVTFNQVLVANGGINLGNSAVSTEGTFDAQSITAVDHVTSPSITATTAMSTPKIISATDRVDLGGDAVFSLARTLHTSGNGTDFKLVGQAAATGSNYYGGDVVLMPGSGTSCMDSSSNAVDLENRTACEGAGHTWNIAAVKITDSAETPVVTITEDRVVFDMPITTVAIDAGDATITTTGQVSAGSVSATNLTADTVVSTTSITTPLITSDVIEDGANVLKLGSDTGAFTMTRPTAANDGGNLMLIGQDGGSTGSGGDIVLQPGAQGSSGVNPGSILIKNAASENVMAVTIGRLTVSKAMYTQAIDANTSGIITSGTLRANAANVAGQVSAPTLTATTSITTPLILSSTNEIQIGTNADFTIKRAQNTAGAGTDFIIAGQAGADGFTGGDIKFQPGVGGGVTDGVVQILAGADGEVKLTISGTQATIDVPMVTANIDAQNNAITTTGTISGGTLAATGTFTAPSLTAATGVTSPLLLGVDVSGTDVIDMGDDDPFMLRRTERAAGSGTAFIFAGQSGATDYNGGDLSIRPGAAGANGGASPVDGNVVLTDVNGTAVVTVGAALVQVAQPMVTQSIDAGSSDVTTTGTITAAAITASAFTVTSAIAISALLSSSDTLTLGGDTVFGLSRPEHTSSNGESFTVIGQSGAFTAATAGTATGSTFAANDFSSANEFLIVVVDGGAAENVTITTNCDSATNCAAGLSSLITGATVSQGGGVMTITSDSTGASSSVAITSSDSDSNALALFGSVTEVGGAAATGFAGGDVLLRPGARGSGGSADGSVVLAGADGVAVVSVNDAGVVVAQPMTTASIDAGSATIETTGQVLGADMAATVSITAPSVVASTSLTTPLMLGSSGVLRFGEDTAFTIARPVASSGAGSDFSLVGQTGASNENGGDLVLKGGTRGGSSADDGNVVLTDAAGTPIMRVGSAVSGVQIDSPISVGTITSTSTITTSGTLVVGTLSATTTVTAGTVVGTNSITTPAIISENNTVAFGGDAEFVVSKPAHTSGNGSSLVFQGQNAASGGDFNGGNLELRGGQLSGSGTEGSVVLADAAGAAVMSFSGTAATVATGKTLTVEGPMYQKGKRVSTPPTSDEITANYQITAHGDLVTIDRELIVLRCDNQNADMRESLNPAFAPGINGQIVHVINIGEDYCQMQRNGPSQADGTAKFKLINNANRLCLKSTADGGGPITFFYYWDEANGSGGWQQMTPGPTSCE